MTLKTYDPHLRPTLNINLNEPPYERWQKPAKTFRGELQDLLDEVVAKTKELIDSGNLPKLLHGVAESLINPASSIAVWVIDSVAKAFGKEYPAEIEGLAKGAGVPYSHVLLANLMYDITQIYKHLGSMACSSYSFNLKGRPVLVRNMDWQFPPSLGRHSRIMEYHRGQNMYQSIGVVGLVGVLSAIYKGKWAVTLNQAPVKQVGIRYIHMPALQRLREACDKMTDFNGLVRLISQSKNMSPFFAHVVGISPIEHVVISGLGNSSEFRTLGTKQYMVQTNHFVGPKIDRFNPDELMEEDDTGCRYAAITRRLKKEVPKSLKGAWNVMKGGLITNTNTTQQSMVLCPATGHLSLRIRVD